MASKDGEPMNTKGCLSTYDNSLTYFLFEITLLKKKKENKWLPKIFSWVKIADQGIIKWLNNQITKVKWLLYKCEHHLKISKWFFSNFLTKGTWEMRHEVWYHVLQSTVWMRPPGRVQNCLGLPPWRSPCSYWLTFFMLGARGIPGFKRVTNSHYLNRKTFCPWFPKMPSGMLRRVDIQFFWICSVSGFWRAP